MTRRLVLKPQADRDINKHFEYIANDNLEAAIRFYEAAFRAFDVLLTNPHIGPARDFDNPELKDIRIWLVKGFEKYLIFYRAYGSVSRDSPSSSCVQRYRQNIERWRKRN